MDPFSSSTRKNSYHLRKLFSWREERRDGRGLLLTLICRLCGSSSDCVLTSNGLAGSVVPTEGMVCAPSPASRCTNIPLTVSSTRCHTSSQSPSHHTLKTVWSSPLVKLLESLSDKSQWTLDTVSVLLSPEVIM